MKGGSIAKDPEPIVREPGNLIDYEFTKEEMQVIYHFIDFGNRKTSYRKFIKETISDASVYRWFNRKDVQAKIVEVGRSLSVYDTTCDKVLLNIVCSLTAANKDKIAAIKVWNELRKRTTQQIAIDQTTKIDFSNVTDENLESIVKQILKLEDGQETQYPIN